MDEKLLGELLVGIANSDHKDQGLTQALLIAVVALVRTHPDPQAFAALFEHTVKNSVIDMTAPPSMVEGFNSGIQTVRLSLEAAGVKGSTS